MKLTFSFPKVKKGGMGSGHFGHSGRPGKVGGSSGVSGGGGGSGNSSFDDSNVLSDGTKDIARMSAENAEWYVERANSGVLSATTGLTSVRKNSDGTGVLVRDADKMPKFSTVLFENDSRQRQSKQWSIGIAPPYMKHVLATQPGQFAKFLQPSGQSGKFRLYRSNSGTQAVLFDISFSKSMPMAVFPWSEINKLK